MADSRRFIQLSQPGSEATLDCGEAWHSTAHGHQRKFMQLDGRWIAEKGDEHGDELWAWGEWEAQSELLRDLDCSGDRGLPLHLWAPFYAVIDDCRELHNTDPFIFGERFLYSNCQQWGPRRNGLRCLDRGSVIAFGSRVSREWVLDTVLVVANFIDYEARDVRSMLAESTHEAFLEVTGGPISHRDGVLRLYMGATPDARVDGMYSFFPAMPAGGDTGFSRPCVNLPSEHFGKNVQYAKGQALGQSDLATEELRGLWESLVSQVHEAGLVTGMHAMLPERRGNALRPHSLPKARAY